MEREWLLAIERGGHAVRLLGATWSTAEIVDVVRPVVAVDPQVHTLGVNVEHRAVPLYVKPEPGAAPTSVHDAVAGARRRPGFMC
jgi:hypothetical protein